MGTLTSFFGGGGATAVSNVENKSLYPLSTELPLYNNYKAQNSDGNHLGGRAGNPLGNGFSVVINSTTQIILYNSSGSSITTKSNTDLNPSCTNIIGACYKSNGNILVFGSNQSTPATFYYSEFDYSTGNKPVGGDDGQFSATTYAASTGAVSEEHVLFDGTNYRIVCATTGWFTVNTSFNIIQEARARTGPYDIIATNGIAYTLYPTSSTFTTRYRYIYRNDRTGDGLSGSCFSRLLATDNLSFPYSPALTLTDTSISLSRYIGYPDGKVHVRSAGIMFKLQEYDALMAEFESTYNP